MSLSEQDLISLSGDLIAPDLLPELPLNAEEESEQEYLTIGAIAQLCGVTVRTLRYYEEMDLIAPVKRTSGKYRLYNKHSLKRVRAILALQELNYSLDEILVTLGSFSQTRDLAKEERIALTKRSLNLQKDIIDSKMKSLKNMRRELQERLDILDQQCHPCLGEKPSENCQENCSHFEVHD